MVFQQGSVCGQEHHDNDALLRPDNGAHRPGQGRGRAEARSHNNMSLSTDVPSGVAGRGGGLVCFLQCAQEHLSGFLTPCDAVP